MGKPRKRLKLTSEQKKGRTEFRQSLKLLGKTPYGIAPSLGVSIRQSHRYASGESPLPKPVAMVLRELVRQHEKNPA